MRSGQRGASCGTHKRYKTLWAVKKLWLKYIFHTYFHNLAKSKIVSENVYFLFSDNSFVKFITTALTMYLDVESQDKSERPLVNRSDFSVREDKLSAVIWPLTPFHPCNCGRQVYRGKKQWEATGWRRLAAQEAALRLYCGFWLSHWPPSSELTSTAAVIQNHNKPQSPGAIAPGRLCRLIVEVKQRRKPRPRRPGQYAVRSAVAGTAQQHLSPRRSAQTKLYIL